MDTLVTEGFIAVMWKIALAALCGFLGMLLLFAVGREIVFAFQMRPAALVIGDVLSAVGSMRWVDTTLVTGLAAVTAAALSVREVRRQIERSDAAVQRQIDHTKATDKERNDARLAANRAVLPLTLASLSQYAEINALLLEDLRSRCVNGVLPRSVNIPAFASVPSGTVSALKEMVEVVSANERVAFSKLLGVIQVESSRLAGLHNRNRRGSIVITSTVDSHIMGQATIYARVASLYRFGRGFSDSAAPSITRREVKTALMLLGVHAVRDEIEENYGLDSDEVWDPYSTPD